uniref:FAM212 domain-containing protein n=1 Tax=Eptatretus burgeri TaxID=7764 RepID=A0A8C4PWG6_EPTBU
MEKVSPGDGSPTLVSVSSDISEDSACCCPPVTPSPTRLRSFDDGYDSDDSASSLGCDRPSPFQRNTRARRAVSRWRRPARPIAAAQSMPLLSETSASPTAEDWTESLLCGCRTRRPLVLGDNSFADLVGQWMQPPDKLAAKQIDTPRPRPRISNYLGALSERIRRITRMNTLRFVCTDRLDPDLHKIEPTRPCHAPKVYHR